MHLRLLTMLGRFVRSRKEDVERLSRIALQVKKIAGEIRKKKWELKGIDLDCTYQRDCTRCSDKPLCDNIREVIEIRKKQKTTGLLRDVTGSC